MKSFNISKELSLYQATNPAQSHDDLLEIISRETRQKYPHLNVRFYPDNYMQAMIRIKATKQSLLKKSPLDFINVLHAENFYPEQLNHQSLHDGEPKEEQRDAFQYVMKNNELEKIGYRFVMKASFGPTFISFLFKNISDNSRLDLPVFYALEILNKLHQTLNEASNSEATPESTLASDSNASLKKSSIN